MQRYNSLGLRAREEAWTDRYPSGPRDVARLRAGLPRGTSCRGLAVFV